MRNENVKYIDENMAVYRVHETSYWSSKKQSERELIWIKFLKNIKENFSPEIQILIKNQIQTLKKNNKEKFYKKIFRKLFGV